MSAKPKSPNSGEETGSFLDANKDPELEKKVDRLMSVEEPEAPTAAEEEAALEESSNPVGADSEKSGAPLLPTDKLPSYGGKKKKITVTEHAPEPATVEAATDTPEELPTELEPFESPVEPVAEAPEAIALADTEESEPQPAPNPVEEARARVEHVPSPPDELGLEDPSTSRAVDEIVAAEADELLAARDRSFAASQAAAEAPANKKQKTGGKKIKKVLIRIFLLVLLAGLVTAAVIPTSRYTLLNAAGVRVSSSATVLDQTTGQPLKNAEFIVAGSTAKTDSDGNARLEHLKLGKTTMTIKKPAFAELSQPVTLGWGSNPLGEFRIQAVGSQYKFNVTDFLSKKPVAKAEVTSGEANARSNEKGEVILTLPETDSNTITVQISAAGYRTESVKLPVATKEVQKIGLVPSQKHAFISKRAGTYDLYKIDVDGKNEQKVLAGTGNERSEAIALAMHPSKNIAGLVSNREPGANGKPSPSTLTVVDLNDNSTFTAVTSERIQLVDWIGDKLIYVKIANGEAESSQKRHQLMSYDINTKSEHELTSTNYFNDVIVADGSVYYSPASYQVNGSVGLYKINADGNYRKNLYDKEVWNLFRTAYDKLSVSVGQEWFDLNLSSDAITKASGAPPVLKSRTYLDGPDGKTSLWIDERDGKGVLLGYNKDTKADTSLWSQSGLKNPVRWLDAKHIVFRVSNTSEIADYVFNTDGGEPRKIRDVTDTAGIDRWYYY